MTKMAAGKREWNLDHSFIKDLSEYFEWSTEHRCRRTHGIGIRNSRSRTCLWTPHTAEDTQAEWERKSEGPPEDGGKHRHNRNIGNNEKRGTFPMTTSRNPDLGAGMKNVIVGISADTMINACTRAVLDSKDK